jgi:hypothetical protein
MTGGVWAENQTGHPLDICLEHYCYVTVVGFWDVTTCILVDMYQQPKGTRCYHLCCVEVILTRMWPVYKRHGDMGGGNEVQQQVPAKCEF